MESSGPQSVGSEMILGSLQTNFFNGNCLMFVFLPFMANDIGPICNNDNFFLFKMHLRKKKRFGRNFVII